MTNRLLKIDPLFFPPVLALETVAGRDVVDRIVGVTEDRSLAVVLGGFDLARIVGLVTLVDWLTMASSEFCELVEGVVFSSGRIPSCSGTSLR